MKLSLLALVNSVPPTSCELLPSTMQNHQLVSMQNSVPPGMVFPTSTPSVMMQQMGDVNVSGVGDKRNALEAGLLSDDSDEDMNLVMPTTQAHVQAQAKKPAPSNGKKTKGRVKIKMEFIDNKLRRYTTFSKRKTGIMKKVNEVKNLYLKYALI